MEQTNDMSDGVLLALRAAVNLARNYDIENVGLLRLRLADSGFPEADVSAALAYWANRERAASAMQEDGRRIGH